MIKRFITWANSNAAVSLMLNFVLLGLFIYALAASTPWFDLAK